jgi:hypothetical protein
VFKVAGLLGSQYSSNENCYQQAMRFSRHRAGFGYNPIPFSSRPKAEHDDTHTGF